MTYTQHWFSHQQFANYWGVQKGKRTFLQTNNIHKWTTKRGVKKNVQNLRIGIPIEAKSWRI